MRALNYRLFNVNGQGKCIQQITEPKAQMTEAYRRILKI